MLLCTIVRSVLSALQDSLIQPQPEPGGSHPGLKPGPGTKCRVAVLGGGAAGVSAAFWLTHPSLQDRFDVTLYQVGWRLGGKCASGRDMAEHGRIKEHGLHMLMGCYQHTFLALRECYDEWQPRPGSPITSLANALTAASGVTLMENDTDPDRWDAWPLLRKPNDEQPGTSLPGQLWPKIRTVCDLLNPFAKLLKSSLESYVNEQKIQPKIFTIDISVAFKRVFDALEAHELDRQAYDAAYNGMDSVHQALKSLLAPPEGETLPLEARRWLTLLEIAAATVKGTLSDVCKPGSGGLDALNQQEFRSWLRIHGATEPTLDSAPIRVLYDLMFAYTGGDANRVPGHSRLHNGNVAAGVSLQFILEAVIDYKGALLWKMNAGMGDTIFMPFYHVLKARNVKINFFHRVTSVALTPDKSKVGTIVIDRQAEPLKAEYWPFEVVGGLDCWPDQPRWGELKDGSTLAASHARLESSADRTRVGAPLKLCVGTHFDLVVLALPPEVIKTVAPDLKTDFVWKAALDNSTSVVTQALQLWLQDPLSHYGGVSDTIGSAFEPPLSSWADMSHLLVREDWKVPVIPKALAYFCGSITRPGVAASDSVADADQWMRDYLQELWSAVQKGGGLDPNALISRYDRVNADPAELYVQTPAGSVQHRLVPGNAYYENLFVVGDWTLTRFSGGCVESAFESGRRAAGGMSQQLVAAARQQSAASTLWPPQPSAAPSTPEQFTTPGLSPQPSPPASQPPQRSSAATTSPPRRRR